MFRTFARITSPSSRNCKKTQTNDLGSFGKEELQTRDIQKEKHKSALILSLQKQNGHYNLDTNACDKKVGFTLLQYYDNVKTARPVEHISQIPTKQDRNLDTTYAEFLAVVWAILFLPA